ncbi:MAG: hypothetical protein ABIE74_02485 [Pseudomonadota bacterium]
MNKVVGSKFQKPVSGSFSPSTSPGENPNLGSSSFGVEEKSALHVEIGQQFPVANPILASSAIKRPYAMPEVTDEMVFGSRVVTIDGQGVFVISKHRGDDSPLAVLPYVSFRGDAVIFISPEKIPSSNDSLEGGLSINRNSGYIAIFKNEIVRVKTGEGMFVDLVKDGNTLVRINERTTKKMKKTNVASNAESFRHDLIPPAVNLTSFALDRRIFNKAKKGDERIWAFLEAQLNNVIDQCFLNMATNSGAVVVPFLKPKITWGLEVLFAKMVAERLNLPILGEAPDKNLGIERLFRKPISGLALIDDFASRLNGNTVILTLTLATRVEMVIEPIEAIQRTLQKHGYEAVEIIPLLLCAKI